MIDEVVVVLPRRLREGDAGAGEHAAAPRHGGADGLAQHALPPNRLWAAGERLEGGRLGESRRVGEGGGRGDERARQAGEMDEAARNVPICNPPVYSCASVCLCSA